LRDESHAEHVHRLDDGVETKPNFGRDTSGFPVLLDITERDSVVTNCNLGLIEEDRWLLPGMIGSKTLCNELRQLAWVTCDREFHPYSWNSLDRTDLSARRLGPRERTELFDADERAGAKRLSA